MLDSAISRFYYQKSLATIALIARLLRAKGQLILCLHSVRREAAAGEHVDSLSVSAAFIEDLVIHLSKQGVPVLSLTEATQRRRAGDRRSFLSVTFDDGYRDLYSNGFPVFRRLGTPFTVFISTGIVDRKAPMWWHALERGVARSNSLCVNGRRFSVVTRREKRAVFDNVAAAFRTANLETQKSILRDLAADNADLRLCDAYESGLDWTMVSELHRSGLAEIGCHSVNHPVFARLDSRQIRQEVMESRTRVQEMVGTEPLYFAYPFGRKTEVGPLAPRVVAECGFQAAFTTDQGLLSVHSLGDDYEIPRLVLSQKGEDVVAVEAYLSGIPQWVRRRWPSP